MNRIFRKQVHGLVNFYFESSRLWGLPDADTENQVSFIQWFLKAGAPEFRLLYQVCILSLHLMAVLIKGKGFNRLSESQKEELVDKLLASRNPLMRGVPVLLGLPVLISYYKRNEVRVPLGFDPENLKKEAGQRVVARNRNMALEGEG